MPSTLNRSLKHKIIMMSLFPFSGTCGDQRVSRECKCEKARKERIVLNLKFYGSDVERWKGIDHVRKRVVEHLRVPTGLKVLDVLVGESDFSRAIAKSSKGSLIVAGEILQSDLEEARLRVERDGLKKRIELLKMDVTCMPFMESSFDYVVNFGGWEDFTAVSGEKRVGRAFGEVARVLKPRGVLAITFIPALDASDWISKKDAELHGYMYKSAKKRKYFHEESFLRMFKKHGIKILERDLLETPKNRLRPKDARNYIEWMCGNYRRFYAADVEMRTSEDIIRGFGGFIEECGIREMRSDFVLLKGRKLGE
jgi:ubiquinone/menaquinone biosynthesis C-methylase UbiE